MEKIVNFFERLKTRNFIYSSFLDVGANDASWSTIVKYVYPEAHFCLIEPQAEMEENLKIFCNDYPGSIYFIAGAGAKKDKLLLTVSPDSVGFNFLWRENKDFIALTDSGMWTL